jgi:hypothetical protein
LATLVAGDDLDQQDLTDQFSGENLDLVFFDLVIQSLPG